VIRRKTFWFRLTAFGIGSVVDPPQHHKHVLAWRTMRGYWGEWW
jgi:hypothetical protein